jgi:hypothetical protein
MTQDTAKSVPHIEITEPVYPSADAPESVWVTCRAEWDAEREVFVNREADSEWMLDDAAFAASEYVVNGKIFSSLAEALEMAVVGTAFEESDPTLVLE